MRQADDSCFVQEKSVAHMATLVPEVPSALGGEVEELAGTVGREVSNR